MAYNGNVYTPFGALIPEATPGQGQNQQDPSTAPPPNLPIHAPIQYNNPYIPPSQYPQNPSYLQPGTNKIQGQNNQGDAQPWTEYGWASRHLFSDTHTGLPPYFQDLITVHPFTDPRHPARAIFFFVNDGPKRDDEDDDEYRFRVKMATWRMGIEHRHKPEGPQARDYPGGIKNPEWKRLEAEYIRDCKRKMKDHKDKLTPTNIHYDRGYEFLWNAKKGVRSYGNSVKRANAVAEVREHFRQAGYDRLPTPEPAEDSGDDLWDYGGHGPMNKKFTRKGANNTPGGNGAASGQNTTLSQGPGLGPSFGSTAPSQPAYASMNRKGGRDPDPPRKRYTGKLWPSVTNCERCILNRCGRPCDLKTVQPCSNCRLARAECFPHPLKKKPNGYDAHYPRGHDGMFPQWYADDNALENSMNARSSYRDRTEDGAGAARGRSRSASPRRDWTQRIANNLRRVPETDMTRQYRRCALCIISSRECSSSRPCPDCVVLGVECEDWEYVSGGLLQLMSRQRAVLPLGGFDRGGVAPPEPHESLNGYIPESLFADPNPVQYQNPPGNMMRAPQNLPSFPYQPANPFDDTSGPPPSGPLASTTQLVMRNRNLDPRLFEQNLTPFSDARNAAQNHNLQRTASAAEVLQNESGNWPTREEENEDNAPPEWEALEAYSPPSLGGFSPLPKSAGNSPQGKDVDMSMFDDAFFAEPIDPNLPQPEDHASEQDYAPSPQQVEQFQQEQRSQTPQNPVQARLQRLPSLANDDPGTGPVLPKVPERGSGGGIDMLGYGFPCMEVDDQKNYYIIKVTPPEDAPLCRKEPTRRCEAFDHTEFFTCGQCFKDQIDLWEGDFPKLVDGTKRHFCLECGQEMRDRLLRNDLGVMSNIGTCDCVTQVETSWLCFAHRLNAMTRIEKRSMHRKSELLLSKGGVDPSCPNCLLRQQDPASDAWNCFGCGTNVIKPKNLNYAS